MCVGDVEQYCGELQVILVQDGRKGSTVAYGKTAVDKKELTSGLFKWILTARQ
jgi:hypothetical protein